MLFEDHFRRPEGSRRLLDTIHALTEKTGPVRLMEICGTHTMAIAKAGLRTALAPDVRLLSGPGCPVCVTPAGEIDGILQLCGISDEGPGEREIMEAAENRALEMLNGIA